MVTVAMVVAMLMYGPADFHLIDTTLDRSGICAVERDGVCLTADEEQAAYDYRADNGEDQ